MKSNSAIILAALHLREASAELANIEPEMSLALLRSAKVILSKYQVDPTEEKEFEELASDIARDN